EVGDRKNRRILIHNSDSARSQLVNIACQHGWRGQASVANRQPWLALLLSAEDHQETAILRSREQSFGNVDLETQSSRPGALAVRSRHKRLWLVHLSPRQRGRPEP